MLSGAELSRRGAASNKDKELWFAGMLTKVEKPEAHSIIAGEIESRARLERADSPGI
jgi:hypothetical protein